MYHRAPGSSVLDRHRAYVERRWAEGCRNSAQLWRELRDRGFEGGYDIVRRWAIRRRGLDDDAGDRECPLPLWRVPSCRRAARLLTTPDQTLTQADRQFDDTLTALSSEIRTAAEVVNEFDRILRERDAAAFDLWLATTQATALRLCHRDHQRHRGGSGCPVAALEQRSC